MPLFAPCCFQDQFQRATLEVINAAIQSRRRTWICILPDLNDPVTAHLLVVFLLLHVTEGTDSVCCFFYFVTPEKVVGIDAWLSMCLPAHFLQPQLA